MPEIGKTIEVAGMINSNMRCIEMFNWKGGAKKIIG